MLGILGPGFTALELKSEIKVDYAKCYDMIYLQIPGKIFNLTCNIGK